MSTYASYLLRFAWKSSCNQNIQGISRTIMKFGTKNLQEKIYKYFTEKKPLQTHTK